MSTYLVIGVGDVHGGDAQEVNEGCIVAASTQRAQPVGRKTMGLEATGPSDLPTPVPAPAPGSPGDQAVHGTAIVRIPDPVVIDAESAGAWRGDLQGGEPSLGAGPSSDPTASGCTTQPTPLHLFSCREDDALDWGRPLHPQGGVGCGRIRERLYPGPSPFISLIPSQTSCPPHTKHRDVHVDVGHGALLQLAEELLWREGQCQPGAAPPWGSPLSPACSLTSVNSVEPMSPNSSAPQLANTIDLRGRQVPGKGGVKG